MPKVTALLVALAVVLAALGALCGGVHQIATDASFYADDSREAVAAYLSQTGESTDDAVTAYIGLTREEQADFAEQIAAQMRAKTADFELPLLNDREQQHMRDVHGLVALCGQLAQILSGAAGLLAVAAAWTGANLQKRKRTGAIGALCGLGLLAVLALTLALAMRFGGFARLFVAMHRLLFTNDLWLLDPATDVLIRMMPQPLFEHALARVLAQAGGTFAALLAALAVFYGLIGGMIHRNLTERETI